MSARSCLRLVLVGVIVTSGACAKSSPAQPTGSPSISAPQPLLPVSGAQIQLANQPIHLVVRNVVGTSPTYAFEVATDLAFTNKVFERDDVPSGSNDQTGIEVRALATGTYYWHARALEGAAKGVFGETFSFAIRPTITLTAPVLAVPAAGAVTEGWPVFSVTNAASSENVPLVYRFEIAADSSFGSPILSATLPEGPNQTTFTPAPRVAPPVLTLFWRVTAVDQINGVSTPSEVQIFTPFNTPQSDLAILEGEVLWPGAQPPGTNGHARLGPNWDVGPKISIHGVPFFSPPLEALRVYDLIDRGIDPDTAIAWQQSHGYPTIAAWYSDRLVFGLEFQYIAAVDPVSGGLNYNGWWELVDRVE